MEYKQSDETLLQNANYERLKSSIKFVELILRDGKNVLKLSVAQDYLSHWDGSVYYQPADYFLAARLAIEFDAIFSTSKIEDEIWIHPNAVQIPHYDISNHSLHPDANEKASNAILSSFPKNKTSCGLPELAHHDLAIGHKRAYVLTQKSVSNKLFAVYGEHSRLLAGDTRLRTDHYPLDHTNHNISVRLIKTECELNGKKRNLKTILKDKQLFKLASYEIITGLGV